MAHITFGAVAPEAAVRPRRQNFLLRVVHALENVQMQRAAREIERHRHLLPDELERAALKLDARTEDQLPFIR